MIEKPYTPFIMQKRSAFTMIEMMFVIIVLGILASFAIPILDSDLRQEVADNVLSSIRYTQHLALMDDKSQTMDNDWNQEFWTIRFSSNGNNGYFYTISSNTDHNTNVDKNETAIDPKNGYYFYNFAGDDVIGADETPSIFLGNNFGVDSVKFSGGCGANDTKHIAFDHLGRPYKSGIFSNKDLFKGYMTADCIITFGFSSDGSDDDLNVSIRVVKETGYAYIQ